MFYGFIYYFLNDFTFSSSNVFPFRKYIMEKISKVNMIPGKKTRDEQNVVWL